MLEIEPSQRLGSDSDRDEIAVAPYSTGDGVGSLVLLESALDDGAELGLETFETDRCQSLCRLSVRVVEELTSRSMEVYPERRTAR